MAWNNEVSLTGTLAADPELHKAQGGSKDRASFRVAVNEGQGDNERTIWLSITAFGKLAINVCESVRKGDRVTVRGSLSQYDREVFDADGEEKNATVTTILADAVGADLTFASAEVTRNPKSGDSGSKSRGRTAAKGDDDGDDEDDDEDDAPRGRRSSGSRSSGTRSSGSRSARGRKNDDDEDF